MNTISGSRFSRSKYVIMSIMLVGIVATLDWYLFRDQANVASSPPSSHVMARNTVDTAASNAMIKQLTAQLAKVQGLNDMVILPSGSQNGNYFVSATVDATQATGLNSSWMNADVNAFFRGVYNAGEPIDMAELTFASGTQIIASAGLGKLAYENMETSTLSGDIASALKVRNVTDNGDSLRAAWFQISRP